MSHIVDNNKQNKYRNIVEVLSEFGKTALLSATNDIL